MAVYLVLMYKRVCQIIFQQVYEEDNDRNNANYKFVHHIYSKVILKSKKQSHLFSLIIRDANLGLQGSEVESWSYCTAPLFRVSETVGWRPRST